MYQGHKMNFGIRSDVNIFGSHFTTFNMRNKFWGGSVIAGNWLKSKTKLAEPS